MKTSQRPISANGEAGSTSSLEDFRASLSVMPGSAEARRMTATSGLTCSAASTKSGPLGSWLRTLLASSRWSSRARFLRWQVQPLFSTRLTTFEDDSNCERPLPFNASATTLRITDTKSIRFLFQLVPLEPPTDETGCSSSQGELLPTPVVVDNPQPNSKANENGRRYNNKEESSHSMGLAYRAHHDLLPTPRANVVNGCDLDNPKLAERHKSNLEEEVAKMVVNGFLPTPVTQDFKKRGPNSQQQGIGDLVYELANGSRDSEEVRKSGAAGKTSRLSPLFTEEMMGFPFLWTTLPFLRQSGAPSPSKPTATP